MHISYLYTVCVVTFMKSCLLNFYVYIYDGRHTRLLYLIIEKQQQCQKFDFRLLNRKLINQSIRFDLSSLRYTATLYVHCVIQRYIMMLRLFLESRMSQLNINKLFSFRCTSIGIRSWM